MICSRCAREIPDGSRFCGLCGGKQGDAKGETLGGVAARGRAQTLVGSALPAEVIAGGRRFAALSAASTIPPDGPSATPAAAGTDTFSEGVPAGAMAALLAARQPQAPTGPEPADDAHLEGVVPPRSPKTLIGGGRVPRVPAVTMPDRPAMLRQQATDDAADAPAGQGDPQDAASDAAQPDATAQAAPGIDQTAESLPAAPAEPPAATPEPAVDAAAPEPEADAAQATMDAATTLTRPKRVRPIMGPMPSVIVDSEFDREAQAVEAELSQPPGSSAVPYVDASELLAAPKGNATAPDDADAAATLSDAPAAEPPAADATAEDAPAADAPAKPVKSGFGETGWFMDALDAEALSRAESEDIVSRQSQIKAGIDRANQLDQATRRQYSLRSNDSMPALAVGAPSALDDEVMAPVARPSPLIGLIIVIFVVLGVAGWFLFAR